MGPAEPLEYWVRRLVRSLLVHAAPHDAVAVDPEADSVAVVCPAAAEVVASLSVFLRAGNEGAP